MSILAGGHLGPYEVLFEREAGSATISTGPSKGLRS